MARKNVPASETPEHEPKKQYWWLAEDGQTYRFVATLIDYCMTTQVDRQEEILQHERLYGGRKMLGLTPFNYTKTDLDASPSDVRRIKRNVTKSAIDALAAEIAQHKPRPLYLTKKGNTKLQAKAKKRTKYVEGQFYKTKAYDVMQQCFFDACRIGTGVVKVSNDGWDIVLERVHMGELFVVDIETIYGKTKQIHHVKFVSKTEVLQLPFVAGNEDKCEMVENASAVVDLKQTMPGTSDVMRIVESYRLPVYHGKKMVVPGRRAITCDKGDLLVKPWTRKRLPFAFYRYQKPSLGFWGTGVCWQVKSQQFEINKLLNIKQEAFAFASAPWVLTDDSGDTKSKVNVAHIRNEVGAIIQGGANKVQVYTPQPIHPAIAQEIENITQSVFDEVGVSRMAATQTDDLGPNASGAARRERRDAYSRRFALQHQAYDQFSLDITELIVDESADLAAMHGGKLPVEVPVGDGIEIVDWAEVADGEEMVLQCYPTNFFSTTPASKKQEVIEALQAGWLSREQAMKQLDFPDVASETALITAFQDSIDRCAGIIMDDELSVAKIKKKRGFWPEPFDQLDLCVDRMNRHLKRAQAADDVDSERLDLMREWINRAQALALKKQPKAPPAAPVAPAAPAMPIAA